MADDKQSSAGALELVVSSSEPGHGLRLGRLVRWTTGKGALVDFPGNREGPLSAPSVIAFDARSAAHAIETKQSVVLSFEGGQLHRPIILGLLVSADESPAPEAIIDGEKVRIEGKEQVELRCGKASIVLTRAGKILLRGTYISSDAAGANRLKGGSVEIN